MTITVYSTPSCVQCTATYRSLDSHGLEYRIVYVTTDDSALEYVRTELGYLKAPVVVTDTSHWTGFRPDLIAGIAKKALAGATPRS